MSDFAINSDATDDEMASWEARMVALGFTAAPVLVRAMRFVRDARHGADSDPLGSARTMLAAMASLHSARADAAGDGQSEAVERAISQYEPQLVREVTRCLELYTSNRLREMSQLTNPEMRSEIATVAESELYELRRAVEMPGQSWERLGYFIQFWALHLHGSDSD